MSGRHLATCRPTRHCRPKIGDSDIRHTQLRELKESKRREKDRGTVKEDIVTAKGGKRTTSMGSIACRGGKLTWSVFDYFVSRQIGCSAAIEDIRQHQNMAITAEPEGQPTPYLTPNEARIVDSVFNLILVLLCDGDDQTVT